jgi:hypothetical protein
MIQMNKTDDDNVTRNESVHLDKSFIMFENEHVEARTTLYSREDFNGAGYLPTAEILHQSHLDVRRAAFHR